jgi:hypothetical protein
MLLKVSDKLSSDNLKDLKYLVNDQVPKVKLDASDQAIGIFEVLEEKGLITPDKLEYLKECLEFIERRDVCELIKSYEERGSVVPPQHKKITNLDELNLMEIGKEICKDWKMLARHLNVPEHDIQNISHAHTYDLHEAALQALLCWKKKQGEKATVQALKRALEDMKLLGVVHKYF